MNCVASCAWIRDRAASGECRERHGLAVDWIEGVIDSFGTRR